MKQQINFYRASAVTTVQGGAAAANASGKTLLWLALPLLLAAVLAGLSYNAKLRMQDQQRQLASDEQQTEQLRQARDLLEQRTARQAPDEQLTIKIRQLEEEQRWKQRVINTKPDLDGGDSVAAFSDLMEGLARRNVEGLWLTRLSLQGAGGEISFAGGAQRGDLVADFVNALQSESTFQGRQFAEIEIRRPTVDELSEGLSEFEAAALKQRVERGEDVTSAADLVFRISALPKPDNTSVNGSSR